MNENLKQMLKIAEGRHLRETEQDLFQRYYEELPKRLDLMRLLEDKEKVIVDQALEAFYAHSPGLKTAQESLSEFQKYLCYLYRAAATAMVQQDLSSLAKKARFVFQIFASLGFPADSLERAFHALNAHVQKHLGESGWRLVAPYFQVLSGQRLHLWLEFQAKSPELLQQTIAYLLEHGPQLKERPDISLPLEKGLESLLTVAGLAMLAQSPAPIEERKSWLYAYFKTLPIELETVQASYRAFPAFAEKSLSPELLAALSPWLKHLSQDI